MAKADEGHRFNVALDVNDEWYQSVGDTPDALVIATSRLDWLWWLMADSERALDCPNFFNDNETARFLTPDPDNPGAISEIFPASHGDARVALANWKFGAMQWQKRLLEPCFSDIGTTIPPVAVLAEMARGAFGYYPSDQAFAHRSEDDATAIEFLESRRTEGVSVMRPAMAMFNASLTVAGLKAPDGGAAKDSSWRSPSNWEWVFHKHGNPLSWKQIVREIDAGRLTRAPGGNTRRVGLGMVGLLRFIPQYDDSDPLTKTLPKRSRKRSK